jgi:capsular exopolysaccharide synthesis family protein
MPSEYRAMREKLLVAGGGKPLKSLVFAGCTGGEGSSQVVREFAEVLASSGLNVLLVDADRSGSGPNRPEPLSSEADLTEAVSRRRSLSGTAWGHGKLTLVQSPLSAPDKEHLLGSPEFASWLDVQQSAYDYVLLDAPPLLRSADATLMGRLCNGAVIVVQSEVTEREALVQARDQLERSGVKVVGVVLNRVRNPVPARLRPYIPMG